MEDRKIIKRNNLEEYKKIFFSRYETSNQSFLEFLYFERDKFEQIVNSCYQETVNALLEDAELDSEKSELYKLFGETFFKILHEIKNEIFNLKFYSDEDVMEFIEDVLSTHNIYILDDEFHDPVPYRVDRLVDFLSQYICMLFIPELFVKENKIIQFLNLEILQEETKIKSTTPIAIQITDTVELDFSDTLPLERMILLEKLGVIKYIQSMQSDSLNQSHTALILSSICGIKQVTIKKNLGVMLGTSRNDDDKNSPYKNSKNSELANSKFQSFLIDESKILK